MTRRLKFFKIKNLNGHHLSSTSNTALLFLLQLILFSWQHRWRTMQRRSFITTQDFYFDAVNYRQNNDWSWLMEQQATDMSVKVQKLRENTDRVGHGPFHHDGLFLFSALRLGYLAEVHTAAFSTDPYFGRPPLHCLVAIQVVWVRIWRYQWSWEAQGERKGKDEH